MSTKAKSTKAKSTKAKSTKAKSTSTKAKSTSTKAKSTKAREKGDQGSGKLKAGAEVGLESDSLDEIKEAAHDTLDNIKSGFKVARKKISDL